MTSQASASKPSVDVLILNGPNLNLLGQREPEVYGHLTLKDLELKCIEHAESLGLSAEFLQTNSESQMLEWIHTAKDRGCKAVVINPAAWTHTSVALRDALLGTELLFVEVHLSNVHAREPFRTHSYLSDKASGVICGFGAKGYLYAISHAADLIHT